VKKFKPEVFQGNLRKKRYFEGWYFKHVSRDLENVYAFIPGVSLAGDDSHAFIQVINGITGETHYVEYQLKEYFWKREKLYLKIGDSIFTDSYAAVDIQDEGITAGGRIEYSGMVRYPVTLRAPGIMGWYAYVPFMQCYHDVVSANHNLKGKLSINGNEIDFSDGKGYIEKDRGSSFPDAWIWVQCNSFSVDDASLCVSIAKIPWLGRYFVGFICFLYLQGRFYLFNTYNKSRLSEPRYDGDTLTISLQNNDYVLDVQAVKKRSGELKAPSSGQMTRRIKESIDSDVHVRMWDRSGRKLFEDTGRRAGLEIIEEIFRYLHMGQSTG
jgi:tocopherol cyclase